MARVSHLCRLQLDSFSGQRLLEQHFIRAESRSLDLVSLWLLHYLRDGVGMRVAKLQFCKARCSWRK